MNRPLPAVFKTTSISWSTVLFLLSCLAVTAMFVFRQVPLTSDDEFYLEYFAEYRDYGSILLLAIVDEPLFQALTNGMSTVLEPETSLRILIFLTILPHVLFAYRLATWRRWVYFSGYFLFVELAPHLSWVQLRQGLAVALLLLIFHFGRERLRVFGVTIAGLIHTSMLVLLPCFALSALKSRRAAYLLVIGSGVLLMVMPELPVQLSLFLGRRENAYLDEAPTYSPAYVVYSLALMCYVTIFAGDARNRDKLLAYHAMCALVLPMFFMTTFSAFAERLYFVVRWYELTIVSQSVARHAGRVGAGYIAMNLLYTVYHSVVNFGNGGFLDRYLSLFGQ